MNPNQTLQQVTLGNTGLQVSRLAFGTGTHGIRGHSDQSALGVEPLSELLLAGTEAGLNFWDTADEYGTHPHVARALQQVERDSVVVLTKTMARRPEKVTQDVERFLRELGTEVLDIVLLHYLSDSRWPKRFSGALEALSRARQAGKVRAVGVSCHSLGALKAALTSGWAEVVMARINARGIQTDAVPAKVVLVLAQLHAAGIGVVGMKVLGAGRLEAASAESIQYVFDLGTVQAITIGMTSRQQLGENIRTVISYT